MKKLNYILGALLSISASMSGQRSIPVCTTPDMTQSIILLTCIERSDDEPIVEGEYSISDSTAVKFAHGNLLYQPSTGTWRIAPRQYDIVGGYCSQEPKGYHGTIWDSVTDPSTGKKKWTRCTNDNNHRADYDGWIDLFAWGTSGWYGTEGDEDATADMSYRNAHNPKYKITCNPYEVEPSSANWKLGNRGGQDFAGDYVNADWGIFNNIMLGGKDTAIFRTPTYDEATYILRDRKNARYLRGRGRIRLKGRNALGELDARVPDTLINGLIILPDEWDPSILPEKVFKSDAEGCEYYSDNEYTAEEWDKILEPQGAIFLPAAGAMGTGSNKAKSLKCNRSGLYWCATTEGTTSSKSWNMQFGGYGAANSDPHGECETRQYCRSVRLCIEIKSPAKRKKD